MLDTTEIDERIEKCEKILKENPQSQIFAALADGLRKRGSLDQAFRVCKQGLRLHPDYGPGRLVMARISFDRKMYDWAERELEEAIRLEGRTRAADLLEVEILIERGFFSKAKVILDRLKAADPANEFYRSLDDRIAKGKADKKAKLAETEEFYRVTAKATKAVDLKKISELAPVNVPMTYDSALELVSGFPRVRGAFYATSDGMVDSSIAPEYLDIEAYSDSLTEICRFIATAIDEIGLADWNEILIETEGQMFALASLDDRILVAICQADVNLGSLKLKFLNIRESLRKG